LVHRHGGRDHRLIDVHELYDAMDWLLERQTRIENKLAKTHLKDGTLILFDVSSSFYTGKKSDFIMHGYRRDHRSDRPQIVYRAAALRSIRTDQPAR